jgi:diguanylate cyclase (GGDEF)-like protein
MDGPEVNQAEKLSGLLADFAHTLGSDFHLQGVLDRLVARIIDVLPVTGSGVMVLGAADDLHFVAASDDRILEIEAAQNELHEGPCLAAYRSGLPVAIPDLGRDERFPRFSARARSGGLAAVFTFPMTLDGSRLGDLDLYRDEIGELSDSDMRSAQVLADVATAYIHNAQRRAETDDRLDFLRQRTLHDPLTGLPNRTLLKERLVHALARASRANQVVAVLYVDLDRFKHVNERFGRHVGDRVLLEVANRLSEVVRGSDTLARLSGDEFVIVCEDLDQAALTERVAERVTAALARVFEFEGHSLHLTASIGVAITRPGEEEAPGSVVRDANFAMHQAKHAGGGRHQAFDWAARAAQERREHLTRELHDGLSGDQFQLAYQPVVDVRDGKLVSVEALLRWHHPTRGLVLPNEILPIAEPSGLILEIGQWVLRRACRDLQHWQQHYGRSAVPQVAVNVSPYQVMAPDFAVTLQRILAETDTDAANIGVEVTESAFLDDGQRALSVLQSIADLGVSLILDDFGTGYSSLNYLRRFPFDTVKIDQTFIGGIGVDDGTYEIVAAIIALAHTMQLSVVAEGIETQQQLTQVSDLGSDRGQGYHICRPMPAEDIDQRILQPAGTGPIRLPRGSVSDSLHTTLPRPQRRSAE